MQSASKALTQPTQFDFWLDPFYKLLNMKSCHTQTHMNFIYYFQSLNYQYLQFCHLGVAR